MKALISTLVAAVLLAGCDSGVEWRDREYEVSWLDTAENRSLYRSLENGSGIGRVDAEVIAVGSDERYIVAKRRSLTDGSVGYFIIDRTKDGPLLNANEVTEGPFSGAQFQAIKMERDLPEFTQSFGGLERMKIGLFDARCADCGVTFVRPELGDFAYGEFVFTGERGTEYAYFHAIGNPVWSVLDRALTAEADRADRGRLILSACAYFAEPIGGQKLVSSHVCPKCLSNTLASWNGLKRGETEISDASFLRFTSLPEDRQLHEAREFYATVGAQQIAARDAGNPRA